MPVPFVNHLLLIAKAKVLGVMRQGYSPSVPPKSTTSCCSGKRLITGCLPLGQTRHCWHPLTQMTRPFNYRALHSQASPKRYLAIAGILNCPNLSIHTAVAETSGTSRPSLPLNNVQLPQFLKSSALIQRVAIHSDHRMAQRQQPRDRHHLTVCIYPQSAISTRCGRYRRSTSVCHC